MRNLFLVLLFSFYALNSIGQEFHYYIQKNRYQGNVAGLSGVKNYDFIGHAYIDKKNDGIVDYKLLGERLKVMYPNQNAKGTLVLNLENKIYNNLKSADSRERATSVREFVRLVEFVKAQRPNLDVGVYGIPFRFNYDFQKKRNYLDDLRPLIKSVDFLAPDLYFSFGKTQQNDQKLRKIINDNLDLFIEAAKLANKPLKIFVWHKIHPFNKKFGGQSVDSNRMNLLLSEIQNKRTTYPKIDGVLWWESWQTNNDNSKSELSSRFLKYNLQ